MSGLAKCRMTVVALYSVGWLNMFAAATVIAMAVAIGPEWPRLFLRLTQLGGASG